MALNLNREQPKREAYKEFYGRNVDKMPELLEDNRIPLYFAMLMKQRIGEGDALPDWNSNYFDTSDLIAYSTGDKVKFILTVDNKGNITETGKKALSWINPEAKLDDGAIVLKGDAYNAIDGSGVIEVKRSELGELENCMNSKEILNHKTWRILARHPDEVPKEFAERKGLLKDYVSYVKSKTNDDRNMVVYIDNNKNCNKLRAWCAYGIGRYDMSDATGRADLDYGNGRFVALAPEALGTKNFVVLDRKIVAPTINDILALSKNYVPEIAKADFEKAVKGLYKK